jgi:hypothetical protein
MAWCFLKRHIATYATTVLDVEIARHVLDVSSTHLLANQSVKKTPLTPGRHGA